MKENLKKLAELAGIHISLDGRVVKMEPAGGIPVTEKDLENLLEVLVKRCAFLVNDYQVSTGYTDYAKMLCRVFNIEYKDEDYYRG